MKHLNIQIFGQVQGVFFRTTASKVAQGLGLTGFAKNLEDGSVYLEVEGENESIDKFISWCKKGPELAKIEKITTTKGELKNFSEFSIL